MQHSHRAAAGKTVVAVQAVAANTGHFQVQPLEAHHAGFALPLPKLLGGAPRGVQSPKVAVKAWEDAHTPPHRHSPAHTPHHRHSPTHTPPHRRSPGHAATTPAKLSRARAVVPAGMVQQCQQVEPMGRFKQGTQASDVHCQQRHSAQHQCINVTVIAPGAGTRANGAVYAELGSDAGVCLDIVGQSGSSYDCYPASWPQGSHGPNLESFAQEVVNRRIAERSDFMIFGSRGGQVVLPSLWKVIGDAVPPSLVINGGCAMNLPTGVFWPETAVTFLLLGGRDNFRGNLSPQEYVADTKSHVPKDNRTTAVLYVHEMLHMPQADLLATLLRPAVAALLAWRSSGRAPAADFERLAAALGRSGWSGQLWYTAGRGAWQDLPFGMTKAATDSVRLTGPGLAVAKGGA